MPTYNKLVRDKIPAIIQEKEGIAPQTRHLESWELADALCAKLQEEVGEFLADRSLAELADIAEVIRSIAVHVCKASAEELEEVRIGKAEARGGFDEGIWLQEGPEQSPEPEPTPQ